MSIGGQPRIRLANLPTPLTEARRLRDALGSHTRCPRILIKRDDLTGGLAFGGNKVRKLEFLVADAQRRGATVLVTSGALQSNHARATAAAATVAGMGASLILTGEQPATGVQGNLLLDDLLGAEVHRVAAGPDRSAATGDDAEVVARVMADLERRGERPYRIPVGGSNAIGTLGYVAGTLEIVGQLFDLGERPTRLYYANGSRGTQAGLALGAKLYGAPYLSYGIAVSGGEPEKSARAVAIANEAAGILATTIGVSPDDLRGDDDQIGAGYGIPTAAGLEAIRLLATTEAILLDPVYTSKAMAGLIAHIRCGAIAPTETVVFLHTGGTPALFAHADTLVAASAGSPRGEAE